MHKKWILVGLFLSVFGTLLYCYIFKSKTLELLSEKNGERVEIPILFNGYDLREYKSHIGKVKPNDVITTILAAFNLKPQTINNMIQKSESSVNLKKVILGKTYALLYKKQSDSIIPKIFIYNTSELEYIVFTFHTRDSVAFEKIVRPQTVISRMVGANIKGSLFETIDKLGINDAMSARLAEIFRWSVDFYKIQKNDEIKVIFTERFVGDKSIGIDSIKAIYLKHKGKEYYAFYFPNTKEYYKEDGLEMKNLFLKAPVKFSRISSKFSNSRFHPVSKIWKAHLGTDYAAPPGTPIISTADGIILEAKYKVFNGNYVKVKHNQSYMTQYLHMSRIGNGIRPGVCVSQGQIIGYVGSTGLATGPHVCYRFWKNGIQVNALKQDMMISKPLDKKYKPAYKRIVNSLKPELDAIPLSL